MLLIFFFFCFTYFPNMSDAHVKNFYWRDYIPGDIPCDAFEAAPGKYIGQMLLSNDKLIYHAPATIYTDSHTAVSEFVGRKFTKSDIKILCSPDINRLYWEYVDFGKPKDVQLKDAVVGGYDGSVNIFIGKILHESEWKISKTMPYEYGSHKGLWVWKGEKDAANILQFFILKYNMTAACQFQC